VGTLSRVRVLVVDAGSSSLKLSVLDSALSILASDAGHRVVYGGPWYSGPVLVDADVEARIGELRTLAPLHQARSPGSRVGLVTPLRSVCYNQEIRCRGAGTSTDPRTVHRGE